MASSASLSSQYKSQLRSLNPSLPQVIEHLVAKEILTRSEASRLRSTSNQFSHLCELLVLKGTESRDGILAEIESFSRGQRESGEVCSGGRGSDVPQLHRREHMTSNGRAAGESGDGRGGRSGGNHRKRASVDTKSTERQEIKFTEMDRFISQFYTLISQLLQSLSVNGSSDDSRRRGSRWSRDQSCDPTISEWLQGDLNPEQLLSYFPSHLRKYLVDHSSRGGRRRGEGGERGFESVSISEMLAHFKNYVRKHEGEAQQRRLLAGRAKLLQSLTERNAHLEEQVLEMSRAETSDPHHITNGHPSHQPNGTGHSTEQDKREQVEKEEVAHLKKMLRRANAHVEELVATNQQWALEAGEKASEKTVLQIQLQDAQKEIQSLRETRHTPDEMKVGGAGLMRSEFSSNHGDGTKSIITEREKQLKEERDAMVREGEHLKAELEEERRGREKDRDEIEELRDRVANLRVQAQSKMPTVKELAALSSENRDLRESAERDKATIEALVQKLKRLQDKISSSDLCNGESDEGPLTNGHVVEPANTSGVLVEPLARDNDDRVGNSPVTMTTTKTGGKQQTPIYFDDTPLAPTRKPSTQQTTATACNGTSNHSSRSTARNHSKSTKNFPAKSPQHFPSKSSQIFPAKSSQNFPAKLSASKLRTNSVSAENVSGSRVPRSSPNQPEAVIVSGVRFGCEVERKCPKCSVVFLMLREREFQSHVAQCQLPPL